MTLNFSAAQSADVLVMPLATHRSSKREIDSFDLEKQQTVVIKLASTGNYKVSYLIRLDGAVDFEPTGAPSPKSSTGDVSVDCLPKSRILTFVMGDGYGEGNQPQERAEGFPKTVKQSSFIDIRTADNWK